MLIGVANFRDFGGYAIGGGSLRTGILFRCGHLAGATQGDIEQLKALGLSVIVDLRRASERIRQPTGRWADRCRMISSGHVGDDDHLWTFLRDSDLSAGSIRGHFIDFYGRLPFETRYTHLFSRFFEALATTPGPLLVHCTGGKDRTGMIVALTHRLLDVHPDDIISDYLLSNQAWDVDLHGGLVASWISGEIGRAPAQAGVRAVMEADPAYLDAAFAAIEARSGSLDAYFETILGITRKTRDAIALRLTDSA